jgi:hypothetical protein
VLNARVPKAAVFLQSAGSSSGVVAAKSIPPTFSIPLYIPALSVARYVHTVSMMRFPDLWAPKELDDKHHNDIFLIRNRKSGTYLELSLTSEPDELREQLVGPLSGDVQLQRETEGGLRYDPDSKNIFRPLSLVSG